MQGLFINRSAWDWLRPRARSLQLFMDYSMDWYIQPDSPALNSMLHQTLCTYVVSAWQETSASMSVTRMACKRFCSILCCLRTVQGFASFAISAQSCACHAIWWRGLCYNTNKSCRGLNVITISWTGEMGTAVGQHDRLSMKLIF